MFSNARVNLLLVHMFSDATVNSVLVNMLFSDKS